MGCREREPHYFYGLSLFFSLRIEFTDGVQAGGAGGAETCLNAKFLGNLEIMQYERNIFPIDRLPDLIYLFDRWLDGFNLQLVS